MQAVETPLHMLLTCLHGKPGSPLHQCHRRLPRFSQVICMPTRTALIRPPHLATFHPPAVCQQFVATHPAHGQVVEAAHRLLCQAVGTACLGTRQHLDAAAGLLGPADKCAAVAWTLEVGGGRGRGRGLDARQTVV